MIHDPGAEVRCLDQNNAVTCSLGAAKSPFSPASAAVCERDGFEPGDAVRSDLDSYLMPP